MLQQIVLYILVFVSGLFFGSFLNLVSDRIPKKKKILLGRSKCDHCKKTLNAKNLLPLVSYILQNGKCSFCKKRLSFYYPFSELLTGMVFVGVAVYTKIFVNFSTPTLFVFIYLAIIMSFYIVIALTDFKYKLIPNKIVYPAIIVVITFLVLNTLIYFYLYHKQLSSDPFGVYLLEAGYLKMQIFAALKTFGILLLSAVGIAGFFYFLVVITKGKGMGGGDIKLGFLIGLVNGFPFNIIAVFLGFVLGALVSVFLILLKKKSIKDTVPFGPFLIVGSVIALLFGPYIWEYYINLFN